MPARTGKFKSVQIDTKAGIDRHQPIQTNTMDNSSQKRSPNDKGRKIATHKRKVDSAFLNGASGCVTGTAKVIMSSNDIDQVKQGDILVTTATNIGWTLVFSKVSAIITDIGAPISHAAIVAREFGIPAIVAREFGIPAIVAREFGIPTIVAREFGIPVIVAREFGIPAIEAREFGIPAIVAREFGIPAIVGCGNATDVLKTGDRVTIDGERGIVTLLQ